MQFSPSRLISHLNTGALSGFVAGLLLCAYLGYVLHASELALATGMQMADERAHQYQQAREGLLDPRK